MLRLGWPRTQNTPRSSTPLTCCISCRTWRARSSRIFWSRPIILIELEPLTPEIASSMLSWMYCEKLKLTPGNSSVNSCCSCLVSFSFVKPAGHCSNGFSGAKISTLEKGEASLPSSGRPCWVTTVRTSGWRSRISRILCVAGSPVSSPTVGGSDARIQRLPSSRCGRNSVPSQGQQGDRGQKRSSDREHDLAVSQPPTQNRCVSPAQRAHDNGFRFPHVLGKQIGS